MKRTNIVLDEKLVGEAKHVTGLKTTKELVHHALRELVRLHRQKDLLKLRGKVRWVGDLDAMRAGRFGL